ncbi:acyltransferase [Caulobacter segnis]
MNESVGEHARRVRLVGIDAARLIAFLFVILIHTAVPPGPRAAGVHPDGVVNQLARWAVPFFFIASGYFAGRTSRSTFEVIFTLFKRIAPIFFVWSLLYIAVTPGGVGRMSSISFDILWLIRGGPGYHLWFLPSLFVSLSLLHVLKGAPRAVLWSTAGLLYAVGLLLGSYKGCLGLTQFFWNMRDGPFFGLIFIAMGFELARTGFRPTLTTGIGICAAGAIVQLGEAFMLDRHFGKPFSSNDFLLGTLAYGLGTFLVAMRLPEAKISVELSKLGRYSLGFYAVHLFFVLGLNAILPIATLPERLMVSLLTACGSIALVLTLARVRPLRWLIT